MIIRWLKGDRIDLKPTWECSSVLVHTSEHRKQPDGSFKDDVLLVVKFDEAQIRVIKKEFPCALKHMQFGTYIVPVFPRAVLFSWEIEGYPSMTENYTAFDFPPVEG